MKCPDGFCRDAEHCMQGGRCGDAVGNLTPVANNDEDQEYRGIRWRELGLRWVPGPSTDPRLPWAKKHSGQQ